MARFLIGLLGADWANRRAPGGLRRLLDLGPERMTLLAAVDPQAIDAAGNSVADDAALMTTRKLRSELRKMRKKYGKFTGRLESQPHPCSEQSPMPTMALTLWQPYATLLAGHPSLKRCETRSWPLPAAHVGRPVAVHAAARRIDGADALRLTAAGLRPDECPLGAVVGWVVFGACVPTAEAEADDWGDFGAGRRAWLVRRRGLLPQPAPCRGRQGFWRLAEHLAEHVSRLAAAPSPPHGPPPTPAGGGNALVMR